VSCSRPQQHKEVRQALITSPINRESEGCGGHAALAAARGWSRGWAHEQTYTDLRASLPQGPWPGAGG